MKHAAHLSLPFLILLVTACKPAFGGGTVLPDGSVYEGEMQDGLFHGRGELTWPDGRHYRGGFENGFLSGQGEFVYSDGCTYTGEFSEGDLNGQGRYDCGDTAWEGEFHNGDLARGTVVWPGFGSYEGELQDFQPHGKGILTRTDGTEIRASFEYGQANGEGVRLRNSARGEPVEEAGYFVNDQYYPSEQAWINSETTARTSVEARLYSEAERLQAALATLAPQRPGVRDVYTLVVGGDGTQGVFTKEVNWVAGRLGTVFDIAQRQIRLSNGSDGSLPLATRTSVERSLKALDAVMDPEEDLLLVHLVSHGDSNGDLVLAEQQLPLNYLSVADGKRWLDTLNARYQWIIISACYSGQWKDPLASPERVVFTSAAADRTSFGCSDDSERTWFSAALYGDALAEGVNDPADWFAAANRRVTAMEKEQGFEEDFHSLPQRALGREFLRWWASDKNLTKR
ncbi:C13 family peptidase [uncultured Microbulbifer sp.]|uniref:C13 family peptidase n=1 Tax=uncultured Microbulbifer sp. TaxID=348147 RepID=UPI0025F6E28F|nr:C13 family peptidase [uncultured Microbulbifer sp.]